MPLYVSYRIEAVERKGNEIYKGKNIKQEARKRASKNPTGTRILRETPQREREGA